MPEPLKLITDSNQDYEDVLSTIAEIAEAVHRIDHRTAEMDRRLTRLFGAWSTGGLRGLRQAAKHQPATPDRPVAGCPHEPACLNAALCLSAR